MHVFLHGCSTSIEAKNKQTVCGSPPTQCTRSSSTLPCLLPLTLLCTLKGPPHTFAPGRPFPFLLCFKPEGRWHLLLEAFPDLPRPSSGVHIHTVLSLGLGLPECGVKSFSSVSPNFSTLQAWALSGIGSTLLLPPESIAPR